MSLTPQLTPQLTLQRVMIAACCGLLATLALYVTQQQMPSMAKLEPATLILPALAAPVPATDVMAGGRQVRRVVVSHDRPGQIVFSWEGPDLKVEIIDAGPARSSKGASAL